MSVNTCTDYYSTLDWLASSHHILTNFMAEASGSKASAPTTKVNVDDIDKLLAQEESAFQRDFEVSSGHGNTIGLTRLLLHMLVG